MEFHQIQFGNLIQIISSNSIITCDLIRLQSQKNLSRILIIYSSRGYKQVYNNHQQQTKQKANITFLQNVLDVWQTVKKKWMQTLEHLDPVGEIFKVRLILLFCLLAGLFLEIIESCLNLYLGNQPCKSNPFISMIPQKPLLIWYILYGLNSSSKTQCGF